MGEICLYSSPNVLKQTVLWISGWQQLCWLKCSDIVNVRLSATVLQKGEWLKYISRMPCWDLFYILLLFTFRILVLRWQQHPGFDQESRNQVSLPDISSVVVWTSLTIKINWDSNPECRPRDLEEQSCCLPWHFLLLWCLPLVRYSVYHEISFFML